jgi:Domain of unknown function (DUF4832)
LAAAVEEARASFVGFHGYAREWLAENPAIAAELANTVGYWFFLHAAGLPASLDRGNSATLSLRLENRGVAPLYYPADLRLRLQPLDGGDAVVIPVVTADALRWSPRELVRETHAFEVPASLPAGRHRVELGLFDQATGRVIELALVEKLRAPDGFYVLGETVVT